MGLEQSQLWCVQCQRWVLVQRPTTNHVLHAIITIFTCGLWLFVWLGMMLRVGGWRCSFCGGQCFQH